MAEDASVKFGYDGKALNAGMAAQERQMVRHAGNLEGIWRRTGKGISSALESAMSVKGLVAAYGISQVAAFGKETLNVYDLINGEAKKLNTTAETLQRLGHAAEVLGNTNLETLSKGLLKFRRQLIDDPTGDLAQGLEEIGFKAQEFLKLDADEQMLTLADAFDKASKDGRALPMLTQAMGKGFAELIPLLNTGREDLRGFMDEAQVMSNGAVDAADSLGDRIDVLLGKVKLVAQGVSIGIFQGLAEMTSEIGDKTGLWHFNMPRTEIDADGAKAAAAAREKQSQNQAKRDAESKAAATTALRIQREQLAARDSELNKRREAIKLARDEVSIMELKMQGRDREARILEEQSFISKRAHEHNARGLDAGASIALAAREWSMVLAQQRNAERERQKAQKAEIADKRESLNMERKSVDLLEAEAKGQTRKIERLKEEAFITKRMKELSGLGISPKEAESLARRELKAEKEGEKFKETGRAHIGGVKRRITMGDRFHGLDQFERNQEKDYEPEGPTRPGYRRGAPVPKYDAFGGGWGPPTSAQRNGRYMGGDRAGTRTHAEAEATQNARGTKGGDVASKLDESNKYLRDIKEGLV